MGSATAVSFDPRIMQRYDREGPRYTSYPSARQFRDDLAPDAYEVAAAGSSGARDGSPLSLYVHLPFCPSPCFYCGCNKVVTRQQGRIEDYVAHLLEEVSLRSVYFDRRRSVLQMHLGGGTPTYLPGSLLATLIERIGRDFQLPATRSAIIPWRSIRAAPMRRNCGCSQAWDSIASASACKTSIRTCSAR